VVGAYTTNGNYKTVLTVSITSERTHVSPLVLEGVAKWWEHKTNSQFKTVLTVSITSQRTHVDPLVLEGVEGVEETHVEDADHLAHRRHGQETRRSALQKLIIIIIITTLFKVDYII